MAFLRTPGRLWIDALMGWGTWEAVARDALETTTYDDPPQDAFVLARACGLALVPGGKSAGSLDGDVLVYPSRARLVRQHGVIAHELGHWLLRRADEPDSEVGASYVGGALMLPRRAFDKDLRTTWNINDLRAKHPNASAEMIARRITQLRDAVATVMDDRNEKRIVSPHLEDDRRLGRMTDWERMAAEEALATGETVHLDELCYAVPVIDGRWRRVIVVCELEQLSLRL